MSMMNHRFNRAANIGSQVQIPISAAISSTKPDIITVFHAKPDGRFTKIKHNFRRKKLYRTNQCSNFPTGSFGNRGKVRVPIHFRMESLNILKDDFSSKTNPSMLNNTS